MRARELNDIVADLAEASEGIGVIEPPRHLPAVRIRATLVTVRKVRMMLQVLETRLQQALQIREAG